MSETDKKQLPLWVRRAAEQNGSDAVQLLARIDELLYDGWQPSKVMRELAIPEQQERSLEIYARDKFQYRMVIAPMARLRENIAQGAAQMSPDFVKLFGLCMQQSLGEADLKQRQRMAEIIVAFLDRTERIAQRAEELDAAKQKNSGGSTESAEDMLRRVARDVFNVERPVAASGGK